MRSAVLHVLILAAIAAGSFTSAQDGTSELADLFKNRPVNLNQPEERAQVVRQMQAIENRRMAVAREKARQMGLPLRYTTSGGALRELAGFDNDEPVYHTTLNLNAAISTGANLLQTSPYHLTGGDLTVGVWDGGSGRVSHQEFGGRLTSMDGAAAANHATHVAGTIAASGVNAGAKGMAPAALIDSYDWNSDTTEMTSRAASSGNQHSTHVYLSNHSYSYVDGWDYDGANWVWNGNGSTTTAAEWNFGQYASISAALDGIAYNAPHYLSVWSAGNNGNDGPANGNQVYLSPAKTALVSYDSAAHPPGDGAYLGGFGNIGRHGMAKNILTIGATADAVTSDARDIAKATLTSFSSRGPADDGRIKPDLVANGSSLLSPIASSNTAYGNSNGTSMSAPNTTGSAALLVQHYLDLFPDSAMRSSTLKALLIHTADDLGNAGPDYKHGWGLVNVHAAANLLSDHQASPEKLGLIEDGVTAGITTRSYSFAWDGSSPLRATLCWTDPAGIDTTAHDSRTPTLINDLDLKLVDPNGVEHFPFVMPFVGDWTSSTLNSPATTGVNHTDNVEQVLVDAPSETGVWQAVVTYTGNLTHGEQDYGLILSGTSGAALDITSISPANGSTDTTASVEIIGAGFTTNTVVSLTAPGQSIAATATTFVNGRLNCEFDLTNADAGLWTVRVEDPTSQEFATMADAFSISGSLWSQNFDGTVNGWASTPVSGSNSWSLTSATSHTASQSYFASAPTGVSETELTSEAIPIPAGASNLQLSFWHQYDLESDGDAGRIEFSLDGSNWFGIEDAGSGAAFAANGYNLTLSATGNPNVRNPFASQQAWSGTSGGFIETLINLDTGTYAGQTLHARWSLGTNSTTSSTGWHIDTITLTGSSDSPPPDTTAPTVASSDFVDDRGGSPTPTNLQVTYTVTFSEDIDHNSVTQADFSNAGTAPVSIGSVSETSPGVFSVAVTPTAVGTLQLQIPAGALIEDVSGNALGTSSAITDDTTLTVSTPFQAWSNGVAVSADSDSGGLNNGMEWIFGGDPVSGSDDRSIRPVQDDSDPDYLIYTYRFADAARLDANTSVSLEYGNSLSSWTTAVHDGENVIITTTDDGAGTGVDLVEVKVSRALGGSDQNFVRLRVEITD